MFKENKQAIEIYKQTMVFWCLKKYMRVPKLLNFDFFS